MRQIFLALGVFIFVSIVLPSCDPAPEPPAENIPNVEADIEAQQTIENEWQSAFAAQDLETLMSLYAQDAVRMPTNSAILEGKEAIRTHYQQLFKEHTLEEGDNVVVDIRVSGDLAYIRGTYKGTGIPKTGGESVVYDQKYVTVCQRQADGSWKYICDIWNDNSSSE